MANNQLRFEGLSQLVAELRALPADLTGEASHEVLGAANGAAAAIGQAYSVREGGLRDGLTVVQVTGPLAAGAIVKNTAPHAFLFENGTQVRRTATGQNRGAMPPGRVFVWRIIRARIRMYQQLKALLVRKGLSVVGDA